MSRTAIGPAYVRHEPDASLWELHSDDALQLFQPERAEPPAFTRPFVYQRTPYYLTSWLIVATAGAMAMLLIAALLTVSIYVR